MNISSFFTCVCVSVCVWVAVVVVVVPLLLSSRFTLFIFSPPLSLSLSLSLSFPHFFFLNQCYESGLHFVFALVCLFFCPFCCCCCCSIGSAFDGLHAVDGDYSSPIWCCSMGASTRPKHNQWNSPSAWLTGAELRLSDRQDKRAVERN